MMDRIIRQTETEPTYVALRSAWRPDVKDTTADAISAAAKQVAASIGAAAIVTYTTTGSTALRAARQRPSVPLIVVTSRRGTGRRLALLWGANSVNTSDTPRFCGNGGKGVSHRRPGGDRRTERATCHHRGRTLWDPWGDKRPTRRARAAGQGIEAQAPQSPSPVVRRYGPRERRRNCAIESCIRHSRSPRRLGW